jgi:hypothetical protein
MHINNRVNDSDNNNNNIEEEYDYYNQQDPYAPRQQGERKKKKKSRQPKSHIQQQYYSEEEKRANSYLPYSNHNRDPYDPVEPIYLQEEHVDDLPSFNSPSNRNYRGGVGSILQDNIVMDMMNENSPYAPHADDDYKQQPTNSVLIQQLPPAKKKKWWTRLGISGRKLVFIAFGFIALVAVIWFFVWPRDPTLRFLDAGLVDDNAARYTTTSMEATWIVNFTVINRENWIPTNIQNFAVSVVEGITGETFGYGDSGHVMLWPRSADQQVVPVTIHINFTRDATNPTLKNLLDACWMKNRDLASPMSRQSLNVKFSVVYYIAGISWHTISEVIPSSYFQCP